STTGGAINVITNRPVQELGGGIDVEFGNFDTKRVEAVLNVPVTDSFALRGAYAYNDRDGYLPADTGDQDYNDQDDQTFRLSALYEFNDATSFFLTGSIGEIGGVGGGNVPLSNFIPIGRGIAVSEVVTVSSASGESGRTVIGVPDALVSDVDEDFINVTGEFTTQFRGVELTYVGGHRNYDANTFSVDTLAPGPLPGPPPQPIAWDWGQYRGSAITDQHEIRLSNAEAGRFNWIVGYNWHREDLTESDHRWSSPVETPVREAGISGINAVNSTDHESSGVFGQVDFGVVDTVNVTLGARYSEDEVERVGTFATGPFQVDANGAPCVFPNDCIGGRNDATQSDEKVTWRVGLDWKPADQMLIYGSVATGYKAGGFNDFDPATGEPGPYDPEELIAYEGGYKGRVLENLNLESALFYYDYSEAQITNLIDVNGSLVVFTDTVPIEIYGWENDFVWTPTDSDTVRFGFSLMNGEYEEYTAGTRPPGSFPPIGAEFQDWSGRTIDKVSDVTARLEYVRDWALNNGAIISTRFATRYDSGYLVSNVTDAIQLEQDDYTRSDANLTYISPNSLYTLGLFVRNIEDEVQVTSAPIGAAPGAEATVGVGVTEPQVYGVRLGVDF
ncbi:MAG: TonB-dependent receptor, partial [Caulobacterales bacterium]|nr:TonB-dependent receptor [Caulobacterales bacterium]